MPAQDIPTDGKLARFGALTASASTADPLCALPEVTTASVVLQRQHYLWKLDARPEVLGNIRSEVRQAVWVLACPHPNEQPERAVSVAMATENVVMVVSELATNVWAHCREHRCTVTVSLAPDGQALRVGVRDCEPRAPEMRNLGRLHEHGRGLRLVNELTGGQWGWVPRPGGKEVWALVALHHRR